MNTHPNYTFAIVKDQQAGARKQIEAERLLKQQPKAALTETESQPTPRPARGLWKKAFGFALPN